MGQIEDLDVFRRPVPVVETVSLPETGLSVFDDPCRVREGDILSPSESKIEAKLPAALRGVDLNKIMTRADLMAALTIGLPLNEYQMPKFLYRPDLLDVSLFSGVPAESADQDARYREMQESLQAAILPLVYHEGYAAFENGSPIWAQMQPFEGEDDFAVFQSYLELPGARQLALLPLHTTTPYNSPASGRVPGLFHANYWALRAKASDVFAVVHAQRMREQRIMKTTDKHYLKAEALFNKLMEFAEKLDWDALEGDPEKFVAVMEKLTKIQRTALGLSIHGNSDDDKVRTPSVELIMRNISRQATEGVVVDRAAEQNVDVQKLLENPEALEQAQELILRFGAK